MVLSKSNDEKISNVIDYINKSYLITKESLFDNKFKDTSETCQLKIIFVYQVLQEMS